MYLILLLGDHGPCGNYQAPPAVFSENLDIKQTVCLRSTQLGRLEICADQICLLLKDLI